MCPCAPSVVDQGLPRTQGIKWVNPIGRTGPRDPDIDIAQEQTRKWEVGF